MKDEFVNLQFCINVGIIVSYKKILTLPRFHEDKFSKNLRITNYPPPCPPLEGDKGRGKSQIVNRSTDLTTKSKIVNSHARTLPSRSG